MDVAAAENQITPAAIAAAAARIAPYVRRTNFFLPKVTKKTPRRANLLFLCEFLQITGSFKARGAVNKVLRLMESGAGLGAGLVTASGGNHGVAVAYAASVTKTRATVFLGKNVPPARVEKLRDWGAEVIVTGADWNESNEAALDFVAKSGAHYIHPFADPDVIAGQGTLGLQLAEQTEKESVTPDAVIIAVGGGGLIAGMAVVIKERWPNCRIIGVEPAGAPTHHAARQAGKPVVLPPITTKAVSLAARTTDPLNFALVSRYVDDLVLVDDPAMLEAARWLWRECGIAAEMAAAATVAALELDLDLPPDAKICCVLCGAGRDGLE